MMRRGLELSGISIRLGERRLLSLDARVEPGRVLTVMGPSGSGKSSLLAFLAGFLDPVFAAAGRVAVDGADVTDLAVERRAMGLLFQDPLLFPHMSVGANLLFGLSRSVRGRAARRGAAEAMLERIDMRDTFGRDPASLSGGQAARAALARTLLAEPRALLLDEPFSRLDRPLRRQMRELVFALAAERAIPVVLVTHDVEDAEAAGGAIVEIGG